MRDEEPGGPFTDPSGRVSEWIQGDGTRAHLLDRLGRKEEAVEAYESAIGLTHDTAERQYLEHRRDRASRQDRTALSKAGHERGAVGMRPAAGP